MLSVLLLLTNSIGGKVGGLRLLPVVLAVGFKVEAVRSLTVEAVVLSVRREIGAFSINGTELVVAVAVDSTGFGDALTIAGAFGACLTAGSGGGVAGDARTAGGVLMLFSVTLIAGASLVVALALSLFGMRVDLGSSTTVGARRCRGGATLTMEDSIGMTALTPVALVFLVGRALTVTAGGLG